MAYTYKNITLERLGHDGFLIQYNGKNICIDPFQLKKEFTTDYLFITHNHKDHLSMDDIKKVITESTIIIASSPCEEDLKELSQEKIFMSQIESTNIGDFKVKTMPAYNTNKFRSPGIHFHPKAAGFVGYIFNFGGTTVYHTGDADIIPEMAGFLPDIVLLPVSGTYVMTPQEALEALEIIKPKIVIPMHYDSIVGTKSDAEFLKTQKKYQVVIL